MPQYVEGLVNWVCLWYDNIVASYLMIAPTMSTCILYLWLGVDIVVWNIYTLYFVFVRLLLGGCCGVDLALVTMLTFSKRFILW